MSRLRNWFLASPPAEYAITSLKELLIGALQQGPVPQHVAFVMDGNRRFARSHGIETVEGHNLGFEALARVSATLWQLGVTRQHPFVADAND
jgi:ditrans,polycis-polyprenyl diphosphate synthase